MNGVAGLFHEKHAEEVLMPCRPWDPKSKGILLKYNPSNYVEKWSTPQLIVHGSKDYRLPETEGIGAFHALQQ